jgi:hypothetical protein
MIEPERCGIITRKAARVPQRFTRRISANSASLVVATRLGFP